MSELSFAAFVVSLATTAAIRLGDMADPATGERLEPNLEGAAQMIEQVLYELRVRFLEVSGQTSRIPQP